MQFDASILGGELPLGRGPAGVAACRPGGGLPVDGVDVRQAPVQALAVHRAELDFGHVQPTAEIGRVHEFQLLQQPARVVGFEELARASRIETPRRQDLAKLDRKRPKKSSNEDWMHPHDLEARIAKMKDGRTHLAHKLEQAADMDSGAIVAVTVQTMDGGDCASMPNTLDEAERQLQDLDVQPREAVADKGYHSNATMKGLKQRGLRSYVSEPNRGRRKWTRDREAQQPTYANRRRVRGERGKRLLRQRGEKLERGFAHLLETGALRRVSVRGQRNILKRMLVHAAASNLGLLMRHRHGIGTPRSLQGLAATSMATVGQAATAVYLSTFLGLGRLVRLVSSIFGPTRPANRISPLRTVIQRKKPGTAKIGPKTISATGC